MKKFRIRKILIANRGEIARRILRTCRTMGIRTVAIFSEADRQTPHVWEADEAYLVGPAKAQESYLNIERIIAIARQAQVDAIHPGYGFLSENAAFATAVTDAGIHFIGPSPQSIAIMGNKITAKQAVIPFEVPLIPGTEEAIHDPGEGLKWAERIGYPVLIKAAAGGGGKGMRMVNESADFAAQFERAVSEAQSAFGDGSVFIEKYALQPKHIEVQILADQYGNTIHLGERECSIQRRHQKVVEESPSPVVDASLREKLGAAAVQVARSCQYTGAGTVEFILDGHKQFYFLEMNTRLQVEHPVTEMVTGVDLVAWQIRIAEGEPLTLEQETIHPSGHAIELRVYAEDPSNQFMPSPGTLDGYSIPKGSGIRVDDAYVQGNAVSLYYDPMIAKLIAFGKDRPEAIQRLLDAVANYRIEGVVTTLSFAPFLLHHPAFLDGSFDTNFISTYFKDQESLPPWLAHTAAVLYDRERSRLRLPGMA
ncbi:MAG: acetyl-CoA carboxylase biotin carboxylase subunit [Saprospiraceae bacterium]|nr:acetyl-CoA carboxylase biotin carboxylase subunit [Saprospiraceae bacterium]